MRTVTKFLHILILSLPFVAQAQQLQLTPIRHTTVARALHRD